MLVIFKLGFGLIGLHLARYLGENAVGGLLLGVIIGHVVDLVVSFKMSTFRMRKRYEKQARAVFNDQFLSSLFHMFGMICGCDGAVSKEEIQTVESIMKETLKLSKKDRKRAIQYFRSARTSHVSFQASAARYFELYQQHPEVLEGTVQMFMRLAAADGKLNENELKILKTAATVFGLDERRFEQMKTSNLDIAGSIPDLEKSYAVLGCESQASVEEIKKKYRKLVATYHPDKIVSKDLPEEFLQFANQKMKDIQAAYEAVKVHRGFS